MCVPCTCVCVCVCVCTRTCACARARTCVRRSACVPGDGDACSPRMSQPKRRATDHGDSEIMGVIRRPAIAADATHRLGQRPGLRPGSLLGRAIDPGGSANISGCAARARCGGGDFGPSRRPGRVRGLHGALLASSIPALRGLWANMVDMFSANMADMLAAPIWLARCRQRRYGLYVDRSADMGRWTPRLDMLAAPIRPICCQQRRYGP